MGGAVSNEGLIQADGGSVALAAGNRASIAIDGAGFINVEVDEAVLQNVYDLQGNRIYDAVSNSGQIKAEGGYVALSAKAVEGVFRPRSRSSPTPTPRPTRGGGRSST
jgi:hypothetical protein